MTEELKRRLEETEFVLIGIGEEFEIPGIAVEECAKEQEVSLRKQSYRQLFDIIKDKNYFIVTLCMDGMIHEAGFKEERIVEPCGNFYKLQCSNKCTTDIYLPDESLLQEIHEMAEGRKIEQDIHLPVCEKCGAPLSFNTVREENYIEEGYLEQWKAYTKWLQGTVNRKLCILELGVGMRFPTVLRWPLEKVVYFNQKAALFRVHSKLYQIPEEIKDKCFGIQAHPMDLLNELSN